jgi:predicted membrane-bound mannosyltransferase
VALGIARLWARLLGEARPEDRPPRPRWHLALGLAAAVVVAVVLLSSWFTNLRGPIDGVLAYLPWLWRAGVGSLHEQPWYDYLHRLAFWRFDKGPWWSEGLILSLAAVGFAVSLSRKFPGRGGTGVKPVARRPAESASFVRWIGFYTVLLTAAYSVIPYKTPWCLLGFLQGMILLAGVGAVALVRMVPTRSLKVLTTLVLLAGACHLAGQSYRASYVLPADRANPYVYSPTLPDVLRLSGDVQEIAGDQGDLARRLLLAAAVVPARV